MASSIWVRASQLCSIVTSAWMPAASTLPAGCLPTKVPLWAAFTTNRKVHPLLMVARNCAESAQYPRKALTKTGNLQTDYRLGRLAPAYSSPFHR